MKPYSDDSLANFPKRKTAVQQQLQKQTDNKTPDTLKIQQKRTKKIKNCKNIL